jgi:hypothetical protein
MKFVSLIYSPFVNVLYENVWVAHAFKVIPRHSTDSVGVSYLILEYSALAYKMIDVRGASNRSVRIGTKCAA